MLSISYASLYCLNRYLWWSHSSFANRKKVKCSDSMMFELGSMNLEIRFLDSFFRFESFVGHGLWTKPKKWKYFFLKIMCCVYKIGHRTFQGNFCRWILSAWLYGNDQVLTDGMFSELQTLSWISLSRISQANMLGHSRCLQELNQPALTGLKTGPINVFWILIKKRWNII